MALPPRPDPRPHQPAAPTQATRHPAHRTTCPRRLGPPAARCRPRRDHPPASREPLSPRATRPPARPPANPARQAPPSRATMIPATTPHTAAAATCLRRKNGPLPGIIYRRLQITADLGVGRSRWVDTDRARERTFCRAPAVRNRRSDSRMLASWLLQPAPVKLLCTLMG